MLNTDRLEIGEALGDTGLQDGEAINKARIRWHRRGQLQIGDVVVDDVVVSNDVVFEVGEAVIQPRSWLSRCFLNSSRLLRMIFKLGSMALSARC